MRRWSAVIRVALAVLLALALAGAALPVVDTARDERAADAARTAADHLEESITGLIAANDPTPPGVPGASATVTITIPPSVADRTVLFVGSVGDDGSPAVAYRIAGGERRTHPLPAPVHTPGTENGSLALHGTTTLRLTYDRTEVGPVVSVARVAEV